MKRLAFLTFLVLMEVFENGSGEATLHRRQQVATLQCYVCENCALDEDLNQEMQMCGDSGDFGQMVTQTPSAKTSTATPTAEKATNHFATKITESADYEEYSFEQTEDDKHKIEQEKEEEVGGEGDGNEGGDIVVSRTVKISTITTPSATMMKTAASASSNMNSSAPLATSTSTLAQTLPATTPEANSDKDDSEEDASKEYVESRHKRNATQHVCYVIHLNVNNTVITNRGCATLRGNKYLTCQTLSQGLSIENCQICGTDGCNAYSDEMWSSTAPAAARFNQRIMRSVSAMLLSYIAILLK